MIEVKKETLAAEDEVLDIRDLTVHFVTENETVEAVNGISIHLKKGEILGLVGETGAGKTTTALAILNLVPDPPGIIKSGTIRVCGKDMLNAAPRELEQIRGGDVSMIFITHDLGIIAEICDRVAVMYAGRIIEEGTLEEVFNHTKHPYTEGLFNSLPNIEDRTAKLYPIPGLMPDPTKLPAGCAFAPRCPYARPSCIETPQKARGFSSTHKVLCSAYDDPSFRIHREEA